MNKNDFKVGQEVVTVLKSYDDVKIEKGWKVKKVGNKYVTIEKPNCRERTFYIEDGKSKNDYVFRGSRKLYLSEEHYKLCCKKIKALDEKN